jgi:parallel beta-helix repeat protein
LLRGASTVTGNTFLGGINIAGGSYTPVAAGNYLISGNNITNQQGNDVIIAGDSGTVSGNIIWGGSNAGIRRSGYPIGKTIIEKNLVINNQFGILIDRADDNSTIQDNTITNNIVGIKNPTSRQTITGNNIYNNSQYNIQAGSTGATATLANNYWGTTDQTAISNSIYDSKNDFNLGTVTFTPFLTSTNNQAAPTNTQFPTPIPTSPTPTQSTAPTLTKPYNSSNWFWQRNRSTH